MPRLSINIEEILSRAHGNFEEKNKVIESSVIITNYRIIVNTYYNYIINAQYNYYRGTAVAQWLRCCATNRKVVDSIPAGVMGIFH